MRERIEVRDFKYDADLVEELNLLMVVKSFDVQAIRKRYLNAQKNSSGKIGSVERRKAGLGGLVKVKSASDKIIDSKIIAEMKEPRALAMQKGRFAIAPENRILLVEESIKNIENDWFSYIHSIKFHPHENKLLVCSSGFDCFFEYDLDSMNISYEWFSWEHGLNEGKNAEGEAQYLTRVEEVHKASVVKGALSLYIDNPKNQSLPTAQRAAFINSVDYSPDGNSYILTLFHKGEVLEVDPATGKWEVLIDNLKHPHGAQYMDTRNLLVTNTAKESFIIQQIDSRKEIEYSFEGLRNKPLELQNMSWVQNSIAKDGIIISIDSNRSSLILSDIKNQRYASLSFNKNWAVQDIISAELNEEQNKLLSEL